MNRDTNLVFDQVRATALISLNYKYGPTGLLGVNAAIRPHSTLPCNGRIPKCKKLLSYKDRCTLIGVQTDPRLDCHGIAVTIPLSAPRP